LSLSRVALVTGGAVGEDGIGGIGAAVCTALAKTGHRVAVADINGKGAERTAAGLTGSGHIGLQLDVTDRAASQEIFAEIEKNMGQVAVLVTAAGFVDQDMTCTMDRIREEDWDKTFNINVKGTLNLVQACLSARRANPVDNGRIIMISSISAYRNNGRADYVASKAAINGMVHVASREAAVFGMTVNGVAPGPIDTPLFHHVNGPERVEGMLKVVPAGRLGQPEDIASMVAFLASEEASYVTGTIMDVDGGLTAR